MTAHMDGISLIRRVILGRVARSLLLLIVVPMWECGCPTLRDFLTVDREDVAAPGVEGRFRTIIRQLRRYISSCFLLFFFDSVSKTEK